MAKDTINVGGEERVVREDTAKSYRGTIWALVSIAIFVVIAAIVFFGFLGKKAVGDQPIQSPGQIEQKRQ